MTDLEDRLGEFAGRLDYPMFIVTTAAGGERSGCLVGFVTQASIEPPRYVVALSKNNHTHTVALRATSLALHLVPRAADPIARLFGEQTGDEIDKFERCGWSEGDNGVPLLDECPTRVVGGIEQRLDVGDHTLLLMTPEDAHVGPDEGFLPFSAAKQYEPGHEA